MDCVAEEKSNWIWDLIGPLLGLAALSLLVVWLILTYRARLLQAWETRHINALKRRSDRVSYCMLLNRLASRPCLGEVLSCAYRPLA